MARSCRLILQQLRILELPHPRERARVGIGLTVINVGRDRGEPFGTQPIADALNERLDPGRMHADENAGWIRGSRARDERTHRRGANLELGPFAHTQPSSRTLARRAMIAARARERGSGQRGRNANSNAMVTPSITTLARACSTSGGVSACVAGSSAAQSSPTASK